MNKPKGTSGRPSLLRSVAFILLLLIGLILLLMALGVDPVRQVEQEELIERPHG